MENVRTKRAKKPNPKYSDSDYETIAALRRPSKQIKLDRRSSHQSEKEPPLDVMNSSSSVSDYEESLTKERESRDSKLLSEEDIKVEVDVGDAGDEDVPISNGKVSPILIDRSPIKNDEIHSEEPDTHPTENKILPVTLNVNDSPVFENVPNTDTMSSILKNQVHLNKRLDKIEHQISQILEILHKKPTKEIQSEIINKTMKNIKLQKSSTNK